MKAIFKEKTVYGTALFFPVNEQAKIIVDLLKVKTLPKNFTDTQKKAVQALGLEIVKLSWNDTPITTN